MSKFIRINMKLLVCGMNEEEKMRSQHGTKSHILSIFWGFQHFYFLFKKNMRLLILHIHLLHTSSHRNAGSVLIHWVEIGFKISASENIKSLRISDDHVARQQTGKGFARIDQVC